MRQRSRRRLPTTLGLAGLLLVSACGSTARETAGGVRGGGGLEGRGLVGQPGEEPATASAEGEGATAADGSPGTPTERASSLQSKNRAGTAPVPAGGAASAPGVGSGQVPVGPGTHGVTDTTIEIGMWYLDSAAAGAAVNAITGDPSAAANSAIDYRRSAQAVVDWVNANRGVAGRKVVPRYHRPNEANEGTRSGRQQESQRACAYWTEDHDVFAILPAWVGAASFDCMASTQTVLISSMLGGGQEAVSRSMFERVRDLWYGPNVLLADRREGPWSSSGSSPRMPRSPCSSTTSPGPRRRWTAP